MPQSAMPGSAVTALLLASTTLALAHAVAAAPFTPAGVPATQHAPDHARVDRRGHESPGRVPPACAPQPSAPSGPDRRAASVQGRSWTMLQ